MPAPTPPPSGPAPSDVRLARLLDVLRETEREIQELVGDEVDAVVEHNGDTHLLRAAQQNLWRSEARQRELAAIQSAILNALPSHIALIDADGYIIAVNEAWRRYGSDNAARDPAHYVGQNYLALCDNACGASADEAGPTADGIRAVLRGETNEFSLEYPCHSPTHRRWFRLVVTPLRDHPTKGAVVMHINVTDRRLAEEAVRESEERFRLLANATNDAIWHWEAATNSTWRSGGYLTHFGYLPEDITPSQEFWSERIHPDDRERVLANHQEVTSHGGERIAVEYRFRRKDGSYAYVLDRSRIVRDADGTVLRMVGGMTDLTALKRTATDLARSNRALKLLTRCNEALIRAQSERELLAANCQLATDVGGFRLAWIGLTQHDATRRLEIAAVSGPASAFVEDLQLSWDPSQPNATGPAARAIQSGCAVVLNRLEDDPAFAPCLPKARQHDLTTLACLPLRDNGQTVGVLALYAGPDRDWPEDEVRLLQELADDVAFGLAHLRALARTRQQAALIDESRDAIIVCDRNERIVFWSLGAERIYGWSATEAEGRTYPSLLQTEPELFAKARAAVNHHGQWRGELQHFAKAGDRLVLSARWTSLPHPAGGAASILRIDTDVTEQKRVEQQLLRAQRLESIGTLAGGIAHDLNNMLAPIVMGLDLLRGRHDDPGSLALIDNLQRSARRGSELIKQVLTFARGTEGTRAPVVLDRVLGEVHGIIINTFPKNITLQLDLGLDAPVLGDATQLNQVFMNLCVNARDAMPAGGTLRLASRIVEVGATDIADHRDAHPGRYARVDVQDTGTGIEPDALERIFEPFFTTKDVGRGTGLGLATSLGIVRSHGGFISVTSAVGEGTTFSVHLPLMADVAAPSASGSSPPFEPPLNGASRLVLIVDDEPAILEVAAATLVAAGYRTLVADNASAALRLFHAHRDEIAAVLTDIMMPGMDGVALAEALRRLDPHLPVVGASGLGQAAATTAARTFPQLLAKPFSTEQLLQALAEALTDRR